MPVGGGGGGHGGRPFTPTCMLFSPPPLPTGILYSESLALSCNESTMHSTGMNFDTMIYPSVKHRLLMRNVGVRTRLKVSQ